MYCASFLLDNLCGEFDIFLNTEHYSENKSGRCWYRGVTVGDTGKTAVLLNSSDKLILFESG